MITTFTTEVSGEPGPGHREFDRALAAHERLTLTGFEVLNMLSRPPAHQPRMTDLARATMLSAGGMTRLVGRLESQGFVHRVPDPGDARAVRATLTPAGRRKLTRARAIQDAVLSRMTERLEAGDLRTLEAILAQLVDDGDAQRANGAPAGPGSQ